MRGNFQGHIIEGKFAHEGSYVEKTLFSRNLSSCGQRVNTGATVQTPFFVRRIQKKPPGIRRYVVGLNGLEPSTFTMST